MTRFVAIGLSIWLIGALTFGARVVAQTNCSASLQSLIDAAPASSTLTLPACVYRELVYVQKPLTIDGQNQAEIRGSDVWASWSQVGSTWVSALAYPNVGLDTTGVFLVADTFRAQHREQVFVDGVGLIQVPSNPTARQFALDSSRHVILATSPVGHVVEVSTRDGWVRNQADNVTLTRLTFRHVANDGQGHALGNDDHSNWTLSNSTVSDAHGSAVSVGGRDLTITGSKVIGNTITRNGDEGMNGYLDHNTLVKGNTISNNGWGGYDPNWSAGGLKTAGSTNQVVDGNTVYGNFGPGLWCDIGCYGLAYSNNVAYDNAGPGLFFEISNGAKIIGNRLWHNAGFGQIYISSSANAEVANNIVAWSPGPDPSNNAGGIVVSSLNRGGLEFNQVGVVGNYVHDNVLIAPLAGTGLLSWYQDLCTVEPWCVMYLPASRNVTGSNSFWYPGPENLFASRFYWNNSGYTTLASFNKVISSGGSYLTDAQKVQVLATNNMPAAPAGVPPPSPSPTPVPPTRTPTPLPTVRPTPTPSCYVWTRQGTSYAWVQKPLSFCQP